MKPPAHWEDKAIEAEDRGDWIEAADYWFRAKGASIGHNRRDRYERWAKNCLDRVCDSDTTTASKGDKS